MGQGGVEISSVENVNGANNQIEVEQAEKIDVNGSGNKVFYRGSKPEIELNGLNNDCQPR